MVVVLVLVLAMIMIGGVVGVSTGGVTAVVLFRDRRPRGVVDQ